MKRRNNFYPRLQEGVADKYAENEFHIVDDDAFRFEQRFHKENNPSLIGTITQSWRGSEFKGPTNIYKNPQTLDNFKPFVRGIILINGDLYLADNSSYILHIDIIKLLIKKGIVNGPADLKKLEDFCSDDISVKKFVGIMYFGRNIFGISETVEIDFDNMPYLSAAEKKNPQYKFANKSVFTLKT